MAAFFLDTGFFVIGKRGNAGFEPFFLVKRDPRYAEI